LNSDVFLPNQLRRDLGIVDNDRRYARDAYALSVLAESREELRVIAGRRSAEGEPMLPSRLLFTCDDRAVAGRVMTFFDDTRRPRRPRIEAGRLQPEREVSLFERPLPRRPKEKTQSMRVTEFKDYLACPYRYYLRHVLGLKRLADEAQELDGAAFGTLAHEVLKSLKDDPDVAKSREDTIAKYLDAQLDVLVLGSFGKAPLPAIRVQVEQLRLRLHAFAKWQEGWAANGWRIEHTEILIGETGPDCGDAAPEAHLEVDGEPMALRGRIDRIDVNDSLGKWMIFDYKTSDEAKNPKAAHRKKGGEWTDLQLPLYRHLAKGLGIANHPELAYIVLPKNLKIEHLEADWNEDDLQSADDTAAGVVRGVREEQFWPPAEPPPPFSEDFAAICQDNRFARRTPPEKGDDDL
jgi:RecB family exonuclease